MGTGALHGAYTFNLTTRFYIKPRAGFIYRMYSIETGDDVSETDFTFGVGGGVRLNPSLDIYADYTMIDGTDLTHITAGVQFHFLFL